jgi:hypothetical protein
VSGTHRPQRPAQRCPPSPRASMEGGRGARAPLLLGAVRVHHVHLQAVKCKLAVQLLRATAHTHPAAGAAMSRARGCGAHASDGKPHTLVWGSGVGRRHSHGNGVSTVQATARATGRRERATHFGAVLGLHKHQHRRLHALRNHLAKGVQLALLPPREHQPLLDGASRCRRAPMRTKS